MLDVVEMTHAVFKIIVKLYIVFEFVMKID